MATKKCLEEIKALGGKYCGEIESGFCNKIQPQVNQYCTHAGQPPGTPVPQVSHGKLCYCCCANWGIENETLVEVQPDEFSSIRDIQVGQTVLTTDAEGKKWKAKKVSVVSGLNPEKEHRVGYFVTFELINSAKDKRVLVCMEDHLFLLPNNKLCPVQELKKGAIVKAVKGGKARVKGITHDGLSRTVHYIGVGKWKKGDPLDGHLINTNDIITADLSVQVNYYTGDYKN